MQRRNKVTDIFSVVAKTVAFSSKITNLLHKFLSIVLAG